MDLLVSSDGEPLKSQHKAREQMVSGLVAALAAGRVPEHRRVPLFSTIYRREGAECARLQAYRRGDARTVSRECALLFPEADPRRGRAPAEGRRARWRSLR